MGKKNKFKKSDGGGDDPKENQPPKREGEKPSGSQQEGAADSDKKKNQQKQPQTTGAQSSESKPQEQKQKQPPKQQRSQQGQEQQPQQRPQQGQQQQQGPQQGKQPQQQQWSQQGQQRQQGSQQGQQPQQQQWSQQGQEQQPQQRQQQQQGSQQGQQPQQQQWSQQGQQRQQGLQQGQQPQQQQWSQQGQQRQQRPQQGRQQQQPQQGQQQQQGPQQGQQPQQQQWSQQGQQRQQGSQQGQQPQQQQWSQQGQQRQQRPQGGQQQQRPQQGQQQQRPQQGQQQQQRPQQGQQPQQQQWSQQGQQRQQRPQGGQQQQRPQQGQQQQQPQQGQQQQPQQNVPISPAHASSPARGTRGKPFAVETNYLTLNLDKMPDVAYHYDVQVEGDGQQKPPKPIPKKFMQPGFEAFMKKILPTHYLAYDGRASAYSAEKIPEDVLKAAQGVEVKIMEGTREIPLKVSLKATMDIEVDLRSLKTYHRDRIFDKPMRALQCIEVVLSAPCSQKGIRVGRSFFTPPREPYDLGEGYELWYGLYQAAMLCDQPLLNVDIAHKSFPSKVNLVDFYSQSKCNSYALTDFLKGVHLNYTPPACLKGSSKVFKFNKVMRASSEETFKTEDGKTLTVAQYFQSKGYRLKYANYPCIHVGSTIKNIYIPLELLDIPAGQAILHKNTPRQTDKMIRASATSTIVRKGKIMNLLHQFDYNDHPTVRRFGLSVGNSFITVNARLLPSPLVEYAEGQKISMRNPGEWNQNNAGFLKCTGGSHKWAIINISRSEQITELFLREHFVSKISRSASMLGMSLAPNCEAIIEPPPDKGNRRNVPISIKQELHKLKTQKISIVFVILPYFDTYAQVKQDAELGCGIVTQCIKGETMCRYNRKTNQTEPINQMTIGNILLKVNAKLNGVNHKIHRSNEISLQNSKVMFVGADVSHPSPLQKNLPSIVGVVASHDEFGTQYNMQYRLQAPTVEIIEDMQEIFAHHLRVYKQHMNAYPEYIIYYRDGVSDGQFQQIEESELSAMRAACKAVNCRAKFTVIIVVKRHHTRFFPKDVSKFDKFNNVQAGTIVDRTIVHPNEIQFFLVSHKSIQGTARPTRYNVIVDDAKINIDDLQTMTYNLCHLFPRCNRSVSYPAPAYLSHLVGLRGRAYIEGKNLNLDDLKTEYKRRIVSNDVMQLNPMYFV